MEGPSTWSATKLVRNLVGGSAIFLLLLGVSTAAEPSKAASAPPPPVAIIQHFSGAIAALAAHPSKGPLIAVATHAGAVELWHLGQGARLWTQPVPPLSLPASLAWSPGGDGSILAVSTVQGVHFFDESGNPILAPVVAASGPIAPLSYVGRSGFASLLKTSAALFFDGRSAPVELPLQVGETGDDFVGQRMLATGGGVLAFSPLSALNKPRRLFFGTPRPEQQLRSQNFPRPILAEALSADGQNLLVGDTEKLQLLAVQDKAAWPVELPLKVRSITAVAIAPNGLRAAATGHDKGATFWVKGFGLPDGKQPWFQTLTASRRGTRMSASLAFSADSRALILGRQASLHLFDATSGQPRGQLGGSGVRMAGDVFFTGKDSLVSVSSTHLTEWSTALGCVTHRARQPDIAFVASPAGTGGTASGFTYFAPPEEDERCPNTGSMLITHRLLGPRSPSASSAPTCGDVATTRDAPNEKLSETCLPGLANSSFVFDVDPDSAWAVYWGQISVEKGENGLFLIELCPQGTPCRHRPKLLSDQGPAMSTWLDVRLSADGKLVAAVAGEVGALSLLIWRTIDGKKLLSKRVPVTGLYSPRLRFRPGKEPPSVRTTDERQTSLAFSADMRLLAWAFGTELRLFELPADGDPTQKSEIRLHVPSTAVTLSRREPGKLWLGTTRRELSLLRPGQEPRSVENAGGRVLGMAVDPDETKLAVLSDDGYLRIYDAESLTLRATLVEFEDDEYLTLSPGGAYQGSSGAIDRYGWRFNDPPEFFPAAQLPSSFFLPDLLRKRLAGSREDVDARGLPRPPRVRLLAGLGAPGVTPTPTTIRVGVEAPGATGPADVALEAIVEGRPMGRRVGGPTEAMEVALPIELLPGRNRIVVRAFAEGGGTSNPLELDVVAAEAEAEKPRLWLISVGIHDYPGLKEPAFSALQAPSKDARAVATLFSTFAGPGKSYASLANPGRLLLDAEATRDRILAVVAELRAMRPADLAVIFLSGHGYRPADGEMSFLTSGVEAPDGTPTAESLRRHGVRWPDLEAALRQVTGRVLVLLDACNSGAFRSVGEREQPDRIRAHSAGGQTPSALVFASSQDDQLSIEEQAKQQGFFTQAILASLRSADTDRDGDGLIRMSEFVDDVTWRVQKMSGGRQRPRFSRRQLRGDFRLTLTPNPEEQTP